MQHTSVKKTPTTFASILPVKGDVTSFSGSWFLFWITARVGLHGLMLSKHSFLIMNSAVD